MGAASRSALSIMKLSLSNESCSALSVGASSARSSFVCAFVLFR